MLLDGLYVPRVWLWFLAVYFLYVQLCVLIFMFYTWFCLDIFYIMQHDVNLIQMSIAHLEWHLVEVKS